MRQRISARILLRCLWIWYFDMRKSTFLASKRLAIAVFFLISVKAHADISVIVNPGNDNSFSQEQIKSIFLGKKNRFPNTIAAKPLDQRDDRPIKKEFYGKLADMDENDLKAYWSVLIFTGQASAPKVLNDDESVKAFIKNDPAGLGYIDSQSVDSSVRVVLVFKK
jgi:ABC-type phosphate transport system substrate-binding protein